MRVIANCLCCLLLLMGAAMAQELEALERAKESFDSSQAKQKGILVQVIEKGIKDASKAAKLDEVLILQAELKTFQEAESITSQARLRGATEKYSQARSAASQRLVTTYEKAIKSEIKKERI